MSSKQVSSQHDQSRFNMIEQQIRPWDVLDSAVLDLLSQLPREAFVPKQYLGLAFADLEIPLGDHQLMLRQKWKAEFFKPLKLKKQTRY